MTKELADKLVVVAIEQLAEGVEVKKKRMDSLKIIVDLYNNKQLNLGDENIINIPFPIMSKQIDSYYSKIDEPPTLTFKIPNKKNLSQKIQKAWEQESSNSRSGWARRDRAEKKMALLSGRGISKIYSSSVDNKYKSHYDVVDVYNFVADPKRGNLEAGKYHGEVNIFTTKARMKNMAKASVYDGKQVEKLLNWGISTRQDGEQEALQKQQERLKSLNITTQNSNSELGYNLCQWIMKYNDKLYYLLFDLGTGIWVRADELVNIFPSKKTPYVSWAVNYDEYAFWTKGVGDDILPIAEAIRLLLNTALENEKRRTRPMRMVESGSLMDVNELMDYIPDNVILTNPSKKPNVIDIQTPEIRTTLQLAEFFNGFMESKAGVGGSQQDEKDIKVGVYYGQLAQDADIVGTINKEYAESYSHKGYRFFWGLKKNLTEPIALDMLGKDGVKLMELNRMDLNEVGDVGDVMVGGGSREQEVDAIEKERQGKIMTEITRTYPSKINPEWVIKTSLKREGFTDEDIAIALEIEGNVNQELMNEADEAIQQILLNKFVELNQGATVAFMDRIYNFVVNNLNWVKMDSSGNEIGVNQKKKKQFDNLLAYMSAHQKIVIQNQQKDLQEQQIMQTQQEMNDGGINMPEYTQQQKRMATARPGETTNIPQATPAGTAQRSQNLSVANSV